MRIRPHHLLCMQGFKGYGYNSEFEDNMAEIVEELTNQPGRLVELVLGMDDICVPCPHNKDGVCMSDEDAPDKVLEADSFVLHTIDFEEGEIITIEDGFKAVNRAFTSKDDVIEVCSDCSWTEICGWYEHLQG